MEMAAAEPSGGLPEATAGGLDAEESRVRLGLKCFNVIFFICLNTPCNHSRTAAADFYGFCFWLPGVKVQATPSDRHSPLVSVASAAARMLLAPLSEMKLMWPPSTVTCRNRDALDVA